MWRLDGAGRHVRNHLFCLAQATRWYPYADWLWNYDPAARVYIANPELGKLPEPLRDWEYTIHKVLRQREEGRVVEELSL